MSLEKLFVDFPTEVELERRIKETSLKAWKNDLGQKDIEQWLSNFKGAVLPIEFEKRLALWMLVHFTFYNEAEVEHLCKVVYRDLIHLLVKDEKDPVAISSAVDTFFSSSNIISPEQISGSGGLVAYFFRHVNDLPMEIFNYSVDNVGEDISNVIVIDDVTLSIAEKGQMFKFWQRVTARYPKKQFFLITLIASNSSFEYLTTTFNIKVISAIHLDERDQCFSPKSNIFSSFPEIMEIAKQFATYYGEAINIPNVGPLGYSDGQYTFGFFYNIPDNTLPIFWGKINGWIPILRRYHKSLYQKKSYLHNELFV